MQILTQFGLMQWSMIFFYLLSKNLFTLVIPYVIENLPKKEEWETFQNKEDIRCKWSSRISFFQIYDFVNKNVI